MRILKRLLRGLIGKVDHLVESFFLWYFRKDYHPLFLSQLPSRPLRRIVGHPSLMIYTQVGQEFFLYLKLLVGLKSDHKVLDVGCGCGRVGGFLVSTIKSPGCYDGFDVVSELIEDAQKRLSTINPLFKFKTISIYNKLYNPSPTDPKDSDLVFPYADNYYDIVYLVSVFTHLLPGGVKNYVRQISRVMRKGGKCMGTFFFFQNHPQPSETWDISDLKKKLVVMANEEDHDFFKVNNTNVPEDFVAYDLSYVDNIFKQNGMVRISGPHYGHWSGTPDFLSHQDVVVYQKQ